MNTTIFKIDTENLNIEVLEKASEYIKNGDLVAFPTETVYGLGADGLNPDSLSKIYQAKGRPSDNPLILHIFDKSMLYNLVDDIPKEAELLIDKCWPGPLTIVFRKSKKVPDEVTAGLDTVAIRMPSNEIARELIKLSGTPIAAPSANLSGRPSPTRAIDVYNDLNGKIPMILDGGSSDLGIESTVIDMSEDTPVILRPGYFTFEYIKEILPNLRLDDALVDDAKTPKSPGQKYTHYSPNADMEVYVGDDAANIIKQRADELKDEGKNVGILVFEEDISNFTSYKTISLGDRNHLETMSHVLFTSLRQMDEAGVDIILAEGVEDKGLGKSIMNRMKKSASGKVHYL